MRCKYFFSLPCREGGGVDDSLRSVAKYIVFTWFGLALACVELRPACIGSGFAKTFFVLVTRLPEVGEIYRDFLFSSSALLLLQVEGFL